MDKNNPINSFSLVKNKKHFLTKKLYSRQNRVNFNFENSRFIFITKKIYYLFALSFFNLKQNNIFGFLSLYKI